MVRPDWDVALGAQQHAEFNSSPVRAPVTAATVVKASTGGRPVMPFMG